MSERFFETPETNVKMAALKLLRHKMLREVAYINEKGYSYSPSLTIDDVNEIFIVAGLPVITPKELEVPEVNIIVGNEVVDTIKDKKEVNPSDTF